MSKVPNHQPDGNARNSERENNGADHDDPFLLLHDPVLSLTRYRLKQLRASTDTVSNPASWCWCQLIATPRNLPALNSSSRGKQGVEVGIRP